MSSELGPLPPAAGGGDQPQSQPVISPDGRYQWNGAAWVPRVPPPTTYLMAGAPAAPGTMAVAPKSPALSLLISFFVPGLGSILNGNTGVGTIILVGYIVSIPLMFFCVGFVSAPAFFIWGMIDAYQSAQAWNLRHGIIS